MALIPRIIGQDGFGFYLAEFLLEKGYIVHGVKRRANLFNTQQADPVDENSHGSNLRVTLHHGDRTDNSALVRVAQIRRVRGIFTGWCRRYVTARRRPSTRAQINRGLANITQDLKDCRYRDDLAALRDWGHTKDYVLMQWMLPQQDASHDFVMATGLTYSLRQFVAWAAEDLELKNGYPVNLSNKQ